MPVIYPDTSGMETPVLIPEGQYPAEITAAKPTISKEKKTPMIELTCGVDYDGKPRRRYTNIMVSGPASFQLDQLLRACGLTADADQLRASSGAYPFDTDKLVGQRVTVRIAHEPDYHNPKELRDTIKGFVKA